MGLKTKRTADYYTIKIKDQAYPLIHKMEKDGDDYISADSSNTFEGIIVGAKVSDYEYQKKTKYKIELEFTNEEGGKEILSVNFNSIALSILNVLAGEDDIAGKKLTISVYTKKDEEGEPRPRVYIEVDGERGTWKLEPKELSKIYDNHKDWIKLFDKFIKPKFAVNGEEDVDEEEEKPKKSSPPPSKKKKVEEEPEDFDDDDGLPW